MTAVAGVGAGAAAARSRSQRLSERTVKVLQPFSITSSNNSGWTGELTDTH